MPSTDRQRRRRLIAAVAAGSFTVLLLGATLPQILDPPEQDLASTDVIFVHVGGDGERLDRSLELMDAGIAQVLAIPTASSNEWIDDGLCGQTKPFEVVCLESTPERTAEEARALADLAKEFGWESATVITTDYHVARAMMIDRSCVDMELRALPADSPLTGVALLARIGHEVIGLPYSWLFDRC